jgi:broad specificity phosphatase PhoE
VVVANPQVRITLVRHAEPDVTPSTDPALWPLSAAGRLGAERLRPRLPLGTAVWVASTEVKAYQTLECLAGDDQREILRDERLDEVRRHEPFDDDFRSRRRAWVEGRLDDRHEGWEPPRAAAARFEEAVRAHGGPGASLVIGSHGMVITAWLVHRRRVRPGSEAAAFWESLAFPDLVELELD